MQELEVTWQRAIRIWWAWLWRSAFLSIVGGGAVGFVFGFSGTLLGIQNTKTLNLLAGLIVGVVVGIAMLMKVLKKSYPGFRVALVAHNEP